MRAAATPWAGVTARPSTEPPADLTTYRLVHRAMVRDVARLADTTARPVDPTRLRALRWYVDRLFPLIEHHHQGEDDLVWSLLRAVGAPTSLDALSDEHRELDPLLHTVRAALHQTDPGPQLARDTEHLCSLLTRHIEEEEREIFPVITDLVGRRDVHTLENKMARTCPPRLIPFLVPWAADGAGPDEQYAVPLRWLLPLTRGHYARHARVALGCWGGPSVG